MTNNNLQKNFQNEIVLVLENNFGKVFAKTYGDHYLDKKPDYILLSLRELLEELSGVKVATRITANIKNKYKKLITEYEK